VSAQTPRTLRSRLGGLIATHAAPETITEARRDLDAANLEQHIRRVVDAAPPLTPEQASRLRSLLPAPASVNGQGA
jgi:hypothetical protein